jgi:hypothetical protein
MNLSQLIQQRWTDNADLCALLLASRVYTGLNFDGARPYAILSKQSDRPQSRHSDGSSIDAIGLRIEVFHDHYDAGAATVQAIKTAFDGWAADFPGGDRILNFRRTNDFERRLDDGVWQFTIDFLCTAYAAEGA